MMMMNNSVYGEGYIQTVIILLAFAEDYVVSYRRRVRTDIPIIDNPLILYMDKHRFAM
jgi:hypothetical protein